MTRTTSGTRCLGSILIATTMLASCASGLLPHTVEPLKQYVLDDRDVATASLAVRARANASDATLIVGEPRAAPGYDTQQIMYVREGDRLDAFALSQWAGTPARMLGPLLVRAVDRSHAFGAVLGAPTAAQGTWRLDTELIRLQQDFTRSPSRVRLTLRAVLIETSSRRVVASRIFEANVESSSEDTLGGVAAANRAVAEVLADVASFCSSAAGRGPG